MPPAPGAKPDQIVTEMGVKWDASDVSDGLRKLGTDWGKRMRQVEKRSQDSMKGSGKAIKQFMWQMGGAKKAYKRLYEEQRHSLKSITGEWRKAGAEVSKAVEKVNDIKDAFKKAELGGQVFSAEDVAHYTKTLGAAQKELDKTKAAYDKLENAKGSAKEGVLGIKEKMSFDREEVIDGFKEAGAELWGPFESLLNKDLPGAIEKGGKLAGAGWQKLFKGGGKLAQGLGTGLAKKAAKMKEGGVAGKVGGAGVAALGGMMKGLGGLMKMIGTLGPILSTVSSVLVGIVKLMLDAEASAKELNKQILSTAGSSEFFHRNLKDAGMAATDLEGTLRDIRNAATSLDNMDWGINKETHTAVLNAITAEGVSLKKLDADFKRVGKSAQDATGYAKGWGTMVQMSVAYSRSFGVSLQEVTQFQGEMMSELGMSLDQTESSFQNMLRGAEEAGIATNKFFGIIRGFSADMSLFNVRMESVVKVMTALGKAMSPREAQKFLQGLTGFFKGQGLGERTKHVMMAGPGDNAAVQKSTDDKLGNLATDIASATGKSLTVQQLKKVLRKSDKDLSGWLADDGAKLSDDQKRVIQEAAIRQQALDKKTPVDTASAIGDLDPMETLEHLQRESVHMFGKKLEELTGVQRMDAENVLGVTDEQQKSFHKLNMGVEQMRADLVHKLSEGAPLTEDEIAILKKLHVEQSKAGASDLRDNHKAKEVWDAMSEDQQKLLQDGKKEIDYQKDIAHVQASVVDKLSVLVEFVMNQIYNVMSGIWDAITDLPGFGNKMSKMQIAAAKTRDKDLIDAVGKASSVDEAQKLLDQFGHKKHVSDVASRVSKMLPDIAKDIGAKNAEAMSDVGDAFSKGGDLVQALQNAGSTQDEIVKILTALKGTLDPSEFAKDMKANAETPVVVMPPPEAPNWVDAEGTGPAAGPVGPVSPDFPSAGEIAKAQTAAQPDANAFFKEGLTGRSIYTHDMHAEDAAEEHLKSVNDTGDSLSDIYNALRVRGIKIDKPFLENQIKGVIHDAVFEAASEALVDYYVLQKMDAGEALKAIKDGGDPKTLAKNFTTELSKGQRDVEGGRVTGLHGNAAGGVISAVRNGMAVVRPAAGEGILWGRPGERIGGGGGGGGGPQVVHVMFKGDAAKILETHMDNRISHAQTKRMTR
jgi:hypothetical protein